jgi:iron complex outermembrane receptor protein
MANQDVVSATHTKQKLREAPAIIEVITDRDIHERGYRSVAEALRTVPGFSVLDDYYHYNVGVRGINGGMRAWSRIIKVMIDGQPTALRTDASNFLGPELIPMEAIKRIEVIRGPGSALYGADAFLGVVNIVTRAGDDLDGGRIAAAASSFQHGGSEGSLAFGQENEAWGRNLGLVLTGSLAASDRSGLSVAATSPFMTKFAGQTTTGDLSHPRSLFGSLAYGDEGAGLMTVTGSYQGLDSAGKFMDWSVGVGHFDSQNHLAVDNGFVRTSYQKTVGDRLFTSMGAAVVGGGPNATERLDIGQSPLLQVPAAGYQSLDLTSEARYLLSERNSVTLGADYTATDERLQAIETLFTSDFGSHPAGTETLDGVDPGHKTFTNAGLYAQGIFYPWEPLGLTLGLREDLHNIYGNVLNSRAGLVYLWDDWLSLKLLYGTSFKAPSPTQLFSSPITAGDVIGNANLKPETAQTFESELSWSVTPNLLFSTDAYTTLVRDQVQFVQRGANFVAANTGEADTIGVEGTLRYALGSFHAYANGTLQNTTQVTKSSLALVSSDPRSELFPSVMANVGAGDRLFRLPVRWNLELRYVGDMKPSNSNFVRNSGDYTIPANATVDLTLTSVGLSVFGRPSDLSLKSYNLFDAPVTYPGYNGVDIPGAGRTFVAGFAQHF